MTASRIEKRSERRSGVSAWINDRASVLHHADEGCCRYAEAVFVPSLHCKNPLPDPAYLGLLRRLLDKLRLVQLLAFVLIVGHGVDLQPEKGKGRGKLMGLEKFCTC